ncbi:Acg family FMN-binding oxidoreductase [Streptomyces akebiae]|uniref:Nitroreductase n=1 Tax=Streptomyces akebiae TaxID=2865673 RepID=A0ABX8XI17_9ACTN|nr:hypothetical protein [Streptomyces akebiae]QYX75253.1 hypothetical protein K1J60_00870 [Streptomyces akebiae]
MSVSYEVPAPELPAPAFPGHAAFRLARAATCAPSIHNTQPWLFVDAGGDRGFEVHADAARRLPLTDPAGREMVISCGAALFNARVAVRHLGFRPVVTPLPDPARPPFLARVRFGTHLPESREAMLMERAVTHRHTHRGPFGPEPVPWSLIEELRAHARAEGALLHTVDNPEKLRMLAQSVRAAESAHRADPGHVSEVSGWSGHARRSWLERVPHEAYRLNPDRLLLAGRDYAGLATECDGPSRRWTVRTGTVVVLSTPHDTRLDWLRAGQALQRVLLYAAVHGVVAAFHTQPLELPDSRAELRAGLTGERHPQLVLRLGHSARVRTSPRRPPAAVLHCGRPDRRSPARARWAPDRPGTGLGDCIEEVPGEELPAEEVSPAGPRDSRRGVTGGAEDG